MRVQDFAKSRTKQCSSWKLRNIMGVFLVFCFIKVLQYIEFMKLRPYFSIFVQLHTSLMLYLVLKHIYNYIVNRWTRSILQIKEKNNCLKTRNANIQYTCQWGQMVGNNNWVYLVSCLFFMCRIVIVVASVEPMYYTFPSGDNCHY